MQDPQNLEFEALNDISASGRVRPWGEKRVACERLEAIYETVNPAKAVRIHDCASWLVFRKAENERLRLELANFCRVRLCPMCAWRRSLKLFYQVSKIVNVLMPEGYAYLLLTLTVRNCKGGALPETIDGMMAGWNRLSKYKAVKGAVKGWYRGMEITHNLDPESPDFGTYHPHFHALVAVDKSYFKKQAYLSQEKWTSLWKKACKLDYTPLVDVRRVKGNSAKAVAEVAKYTVKDADYLIPDDWVLTVDTVRLLDRALDNRRFSAFGGALKEMHRKLNLDDPEDGDLVHDDEDLKLSEEDSGEFCYFWHSGYSQYVRQTTS